MKIESVLVTGGNRGIGFEFVKQFTELKDPPSFVFATYREESSLEDLKNLTEKSEKSQVILIKMDITIQEEIDGAKKIVEETLGERGLNLLVNNAGLGQAGPFPNITQDGLLQHFKTNTVGPIMLFQTLFPLLEKAASTSKSTKMSAASCVLNISSLSGSIQKTGDNLEDLAVKLSLQCPGYKISKAALNMGMRVIATQVKDKGILVVNMCPGWVKTDMGGKDRGQITPEESVNNMLKTLDTLNEAHHGTFMDRLGKQYPF